VSNSARQREFLELLDAHGATLMAMLRHLCRNRFDADDVFQETALRVWRNMPNRPVLRNPRAWLMTIGYRAFINARELRKTAVGDLQNVSNPADGSPSDLVERAEEAVRVQAAIDTLPETAREVVALHYLAGLSIRETAKAMNVAEGTVKSRLSAALKTLRSQLQ
jgi:RNA polymerase sigma-70 factor, ECF subfamily